MEKLIEITNNSGVLIFLLLSGMIYGLYMALLLFSVHLQKKPADQKTEAHRKHSLAFYLLLAVACFVALMASNFWRSFFGS